MKLKDIVPYCLEYTKNPGNGIYEMKYYWVINGSTYYIDSLQSYNAEDFLEHNYDPYMRLHGRYDSYINLSRYCMGSVNTTENRYNPDDNYLTLNLDNDITIFDKFIMVHKTRPETTEDEANIFCKQNYYIANGHSASIQNYTIGLFHTDPIGGMAANLRTVFKDLINPPVQPKPAELTLDEKVDDLIDELIKDNKVKAIKKLKRMLNERL